MGRKATSSAALFIPLVVILALLAACATAAPSPAPKSAGASPATESKPATAVPAAASKPAVESKPAAAAPASAPKPAAPASEAKPAALAAPAKPAAGSAAEFYSKNTLNIVVSASAGGGNDLHARLLAKYWQENVGGQVAISNKGGAGNMEGTNIVSTAKNDGLTIAAAPTVSGLILPALFKTPGMQFDIKKLSWVGLYENSGPPVLAVGPKSPFQSMDDVAKAKEFKLAALGPASQQTLGGALLVELMEVKNAKIIVGYKGSSQMELAIGQGEADGLVISSSTAYESAQQGNFKSEPLVIVGPEKTNWFPKVKTIAELKKLSPEYQRLLNIYASIVSGVGYSAPAGVPQDRLEFLRSMFVKINNDAAFAKQIQERRPIPAEVWDGAKTQKFMSDMADVSREDVAKFEALVKKYSQVQ